MHKFLLFPTRLYKGFLEDDCYLRASALSYYTLLSIIPLLAIVFGIAKGFGFEKALETQILETFYNQATFAEQLIGFAKSTLENAHGTLIVGFGIIFLFWTSIGLLGSFEETLNKIWNVPKMRSLQERVIAYLPIIIFAPIFIVASSSFTFLLVAKIVEVTVQQGLYTSLKPVIHVFYYGFLILLTWTFFLFLYTYMPNRFISWQTCLLASLLAAVSLQISQWSFIHLQIYLTSYNAIYGSFAAIPLFLIWLQISWLITLIGAEFAKQQTNLHHMSSIPISERGLFLLALSVCCSAYLKRFPPISKKHLAETLGIDLFLSETILNRLSRSSLLLEVSDGEYKHCFIPAIPPNEIMINEVFYALEHSSEQAFHVKDSLFRIQVMQILEKWDVEQTSLSANITMKDLINL